MLRIDPESGKAEIWKELLVADGTGVHGLPSVRMTADGRAYAYSYYRALSELFCRRRPALGALDRRLQDHVPGASIAAMRLGLRMP